MSDESSFEIVNKKAEIESFESEKGSLLDSIWPTSSSKNSNLPSFVPVSNSQTANISTSSNTNMFHPTSFSPAIPENKAVSNSTSDEDDMPDEELFSTAGGLFDWVKDTVGNKGSTLFTKVAEKAKNSVGSVITALDPQMRDVISGIDVIQIVVSSERENEVSPIRDIFQEMFNKCHVKGLECEELPLAKQVVGFECAAKAANQKTEIIRNQHPTKALIISVQNFIVEVQNEKWYDLDLVTLTDFEKPVSLETYTQMTPIPYSVINCIKEDTAENYEHKSTGFAISVAQVMASNLQVHPSEWQETLTGISRKEKILNAAKLLAVLYKNTLLP